MRKHFLFLAAIVLVGCDAPSNTNSSGIGASVPAITDKRPKDELIFVNKLAKADSALNKQANDVGKKAVADSAREDASKYLTTTLDAKANNWIAYVSTIDAPTGSSAVVYLLIPKTWELGDDHAERSSITLLADVSNNKAVLDALKPLKRGDRVLVSGEFVKLANKVDVDVMFQGMSTDPEDVLTHPEYNFTITDIKHYKNN